MSKFVEGDDVFPRHYEHMLGSLGVDVAKSDEEVVFENDVAGYGAAHYPAKNTIVH